MALLQEILKWTETLPAWQSDAVARLLAKQTLTPDDEADLFALLKSAHGISDPKARTPKPLTADQIPAPAKGSTHVELRAMENLRHVNDANDWACDTMHNPRYPLELFMRVVTVSLETMKIVRALPALDISVGNTD